MTNTDFRAVFEAHKDAVYRFAWRMTNSAAVAEDVTQDVFLSFLSQPHRFDSGRGTLRAYLLGIARNLVLKRWRDEHTWEELNEQAFVFPSSHIERGEIAQIVAEAVQSLPALQREALVLAEYEELSLEEIAKAVESEVGTVKSRLHRARENLRRTLAPLKSKNAMRSNHGTTR